MLETRECVLKNHRFNIDFYDHGLTMIEIIQWTE
jgi:hypothetical protein